MDSGLYAACTALMARTDALDSIANNLANSSTTGFRGSHTTFSSVLADRGQQLNSRLNEVTNSYGLLSSSQVDMRPGSLQSTGNKLDVGIDGAGFLTIQTSNGVAYTRNGSMQVSPQGQLTNLDGDLVLGDNGPISIPDGAAVEISPDGSVSADSVLAGKLKLVEFSASANPQSLGATNYTADAKDVVDSPMTRVRQGMLEASNVNPISGVVELINAQRALEGMRHAMTMIDSEIDKTAAQDLPRVS